MGEIITSSKDQLQSDQSGASNDDDFSATDDDIIASLDEADLRLAEMDGIEDEETQGESSGEEGETERLDEALVDQALLEDEDEEEEEEAGETLGDEGDQAGEGSEQQGSRLEGAVEASTSGAVLGMEGPLGVVDPDADEDSRRFAIGLAQVAADTKGGDICLLHVAPLVYWTSYMLMVTVFSRPQLTAVLFKMEKEAQEVWNRKLEERKKPGRGVWEVLDYGDVVVHVMTAEEREYYDIEGFYGAADEVALPFEKSEMEEAIWKKKY